MPKRIDLTGQQFGRLTVISFAGTDKNGKALWNCQCECGNKTIVRLDRLRSGEAKSCGCAAKFDLKGQQFGRLTVISFAGTDKNGKALWNCQCECGNKTTVRLDKLSNGETKSCGCIRREKTRKRATTHGNSKKRLYRIWCGILHRTGNENAIEYDRYGGRGIYICKEWKESFEEFEKWALENGYTGKLTIDRMDNDKGYSPENCRWTDWKTQENNKSNVKKYEYKGELKTITELAEMADIRTDTLRERIKRGMDIQKAVETPVRGKNVGYKPY